MNETEQADLRAQIETRLADLLHSDVLGHAGRAVVELDQQSLGRLSRMDALQNQAMARAQQARRDWETKRLHAALDRINAGDFGTCDACGEDIALGRLKLDPASTLCINCAQGG